LQKKGIVMEWFVMPDPWMLGIAGILLGFVAIHIIRGGKLLGEPPKHIWCLFRWLGFKEKEIDERDT